MPLNRLVSLSLTHKGEGISPAHSLYSLLIKERGNGCYALFLLLIKERRCGYPNLFIFLFSISIKKGDLVSSPVYQLFVLILYHNFKIKSTNFRQFFQNYFIFLLLIKERGFPYDAYSLSHNRFLAQQLLYNQ